MYKLILMRNLGAKSVLSCESIKAIFSSAFYFEGAPLTSFINMLIWFSFFFFFLSIFKNHTTMLKTSYSIQSCISLNLTFSRTINGALNPVCILHIYVLFIRNSLSTGVSCLHKWGSVPNKMKWYWECVPKYSSSWPEFKYLIAQVLYFWQRCRVYMYVGVSITCQCIIIFHGTASLSILQAHNSHVNHALEIRAVSG